MVAIVFMVGAIVLTLLGTIVLGGGVAVYLWGPPELLKQLGWNRVGLAFGLGVILLALLAIGLTEYHAALRLLRPAG